MAPPGRRRAPALAGLLLLVFLFASAAAAASAASAVLGIDLGTEYIKAALVKPGIPLEIVLTKDSKRKEVAAVALKPAGNSVAFPERAYGSDAMALAARLPAHVYPNLKPLLAATRAELPETCASYSALHPALHLQYDAARGTPSFQSDAFATKQEPFLVEELLAMQLQNIRANAEALAGKGSQIRDAVITVPPFYTADERRSVELAAELAGLRLLAVLSDGLAVGLNYATSRTFPSVSEGAAPEHHLVFDMGAGSTSATVLRFQGRTVKDVGRLNKTIQEVNVVGTGWNRGLGGDALNAIILDHMIEEFVASPKAASLALKARTVKANGRTVAKLLKEAERLRQVLSANTETAASFEGLYEEVDFRYKITRAQFEEMVSDFAAQVKTPINQALKAANLTMDELDSVILHGGAIRTPFVQKQLEKVVGDAAKLRTNVNSDEAAVFGAAFKGAGLSASFRVKEIRTTDGASYAAGVGWQADGKERRQKIFQPTSQTGNEKQVPFKQQDDFTFHLFQQLPAKDRGDDERIAPVARVQTKNLTASVALLVDKYGCVAANITTKFGFRLAPNNALLEVTRGTVSCEVEDTDKKGGVVDDVKGFFGFGSKKDEQQALQDEAESGESSTPEASTRSDDTTTSASATSEGSTGTTSTIKSAEAASPTSKRIQSVPVSFTVERDGLPEVSSTESKRMKARLADFDASDKSRRLREEAVNTLEAFTYRSRDLLSDESFIAASTEQERQTLDAKVSAASDWLYGDGADAEKAALKARLKELKDLVDPVETRRTEAAKRPGQIQSLREALNQTKMLIGVIEEQVKQASENPTTEVQTTTTTTTTTTAEPDNLDDLDDFPDVTTATSTSTSTRAAKASDVPRYTMEDVAKITSQYTDVEQWLETKLAEQEQLAAYEDPAILTAEMEAKSKELNQALMEVLQKKMKIPAKPKSSTQSSTKSKTKSKKGSSKSRSKSKGAKTSKTTDEATATEELGDLPTFRVEEGEFSEMSGEEIRLAVERAKAKAEAEAAAEEKDIHDEL
ncbi:MAG: lumenal Hsp70 protein [Thelocarpon superellum]|nr:MAG: lumenal Hsp70 protein [Thelocarpon superellum]